MLLTVAGGAAGAIYAAVKTPTYVAKAYVVATASRSDPATALNFAQAYGRIATSGPVLATARRRLHDSSGLSSVRSSSSPDAPVVEIVATGADARHTADLANAVARGLADYASERSRDTNVKLSVLAPATVPARPSSPKPPLELAVGAAVGLLIGGLVVMGATGRREPMPHPDSAGASPHTGPAPVVRPVRTVAKPLFAMPPIPDSDGSARTALLRAVPDRTGAPTPGTAPPRITGRAAVDDLKEER